PNDTVACYTPVNLVTPIATDNCDLSVPVTVGSNNLVKYTCIDSFTAIRTIVYNAVDDYGNQADPCVHRIYYTRATLDAPVFQFPLNRDDVQAPALNCDNVPVWDVVKADGTPGRDNYPQPSESGAPTLDGYPIYPNGTLCE